MAIKDFDESEQSDLDQFGPSQARHRAGSTELRTNVFGVHSFALSVAGKNVKKVFKDSRRGRKCRFSEAEVQKSQKLLGPSTIFSNAKKIRIFKKMTFLPIQASVPRPFQLYKIFFYIIYSGNIISCSKRELTEY